MEHIILLLSWALLLNTGVLWPWNPWKRIELPCGFPFIDSCIDYWLIHCEPKGFLATPKLPNGVTCCSIWSSCSDQLFGWSGPSILGSHRMSHSGSSMQKGDTRCFLVMKPTPPKGWEKGPVCNFCNFRPLFLSLLWLIMYVPHWAATYVFGSCHMHITPTCCQGILLFLDSHT